MLFAVREPTGKYFCLSFILYFFYSFCVVWQHLLYRPSSSPGKFCSLPRWMPRTLRRVWPAPRTPPGVARAPAMATRWSSWTPWRLWLPWSPTVRPRTMIPCPWPTAYHIYSFCDQMEFFLEQNEVFYFFF